MPCISTVESTKVLRRGENSVHARQNSGGIVAPLPRKGGPLLVLLVREAGPRTGNERRRSQGERSLRKFAGGRSLEVSCGVEFNLARNGERRVLVPQVLSEDGRGTVSQV